MANTFSITGTTFHSTTVSGLENGGRYTYYVRCEDAASNANPDDYPITFSVAEPLVLRAYTLTGLTNYTWYTVTLNAMSGSVSFLADTVTVLPTDIFVYLPLVLRDN
jgi:hypothetical protein